MHRIGKGELETDVIEVDLSEGNQGESLDLIVRDGELTLLRATFTSEGSLATVKFNQDLTIEVYCDCIQIKDQFHVYVLEVDLDTLLKLVTR